MATVKRVVCLANSRKTRGKCIAGRVINGDRAQEWIRPVSDREHEEVNDTERMCTDGREPDLLDVLEIPLLGPVPHTYQTENWRLDPTRRWKRLATCGSSILEQCAETPQVLWRNGYSSGSARNDRIPIPEANEFDRSLHLIHLDGIVVRVYSSYGYRKLQGKFRYNEHDYALRITDPRIEDTYRERPYGSYSLSNVFATISLGEPFGDYVYKLIAAVIQPE
jgi:hypothetical protein